MRERAETPQSKAGAARHLTNPFLEATSGILTKMFQFAFPSSFLLWLHPALPALCSHQPLLTPEPWWQKQDFNGLAILKSKTSSSLARLFYGPSPMADLESSD